MRRKPFIYGLIILAAAVLFYNMPHWPGMSEKAEESSPKADAKTLKAKSTGQFSTADYKKKLGRMKPKQPYIVIDRYANRLYLRTEDKIIQEMICSVGSGGELVDSLSGRRWQFTTPSGVFKVGSKLVDPWWRKPDWAFIEENESIPKNERDRYDSEMMGEYALGFGDGYFIHGTIYERLLGVSVTHGCVRVGAEDLRKLYERVSIGTPIYIY